jgi:hypothetical protein
MPSAWFTPNSTSDQSTVRIPTMRTSSIAESRMSSQKRNLVRLVIASLAIGVVPATGCHVSKTKPVKLKLSGDPAVYHQHMTQIRPTEPAIDCKLNPYAEAHSPRDLDTLIDDGKLTDEHVLKYSLQECIAQALSSSTIMRDLGVSVLRYPGMSGANADPALTFTDPRFGEEAALSAFDANAFASSMYDKNDRKFNNQFYGQGGFLQQDLSNTQFGVSKRSATGGLFSLRNISIYDRNNQITNAFPYSWENYVEAQIRQPLLQGAGSQYNMIAGPNAIPGQLNGVLLARVRTDIALVDFERSVRDYVAEVENAYWDLYYAYRDLEARIMVRDIAAEYANSIGLREVQKADRAQATEQVIRFQADIVESLNGRPIDGTRTYNGTTGGAFRGNGGVRVCERKLRLLMGLPINDGKLVRPIDKPTVAKVDYDYQFLVQEALNGREELRRQRWVIKQRELELIGHRNFLKPQLDLVNTFRLRGMGGSGTNLPGFGQLTGSGSAVSSMFNGDFPEWQVGIEYLAPVGFRRGNSAVRYSQLALAKEVDILREQERGVHLGISNAVNETKRAYELVDLQKQRREQIETQLDALQKKLNEEQSETALDVVLETQRRLLDATIRYHQAEIEYVLSIRNVNLEKGSLLQYCNVYINEAATSQDAISDAVQRVAMQSSSAPHNAQHSVIGKPIAK